MKFLLITLEYFPFKGGVANYYGNLVKYWPIEEKISVISNNQGELINPEQVIPWSKTISLILNKKRQKSFDYLLVGHILPLGTAAYIATWFRRFKYGVILHGLDFTLATSTAWKRFLTKLILKRANKIICANSYLASLVKNFFPKLEAKTFIVNPGIDPIIPDANCDKVKEIRSKYDLDNNFSLVTLGRLVLRKGVDQVIGALSNLSIENYKIKYFIIGEGPEEAHLKSLAAASPIKENIFFINEISDADKWCWLYACDVFIMPARQIGNDFEGFGIVYLEANLTKKPVIAGASGGVKDAVENEVNGLLVNPESLEDIRNAILRLANDKELRTRLGEQGRERAIKNFRFEKQSERLLKIIKN